MIDWTQYGTLGGAAALLLYYFWPQIKKYLPAIGGGSTPDDPRVEVARLIVRLTELAEQDGNPKASECCGHLWDAFSPGTHADA